MKLLCLVALMLAQAQAGVLLSGPPSAKAGSTITIEYVTDKCKGSEKPKSKSWKMNGEQKSKNVQCYEGSSKQEYVCEYEVQEENGSSFEIKYGQNSNTITVELERDITGVFTNAAASEDGETITVTYTTNERVIFGTSDFRCTTGDTISIEQTQVNKIDFVVPGSTEKKITCTAGEGAVISPVSGNAAAAVEAELKISKTRSIGAAPGAGEHLGMCSGPASGDSLCSASTGGAQEAEGCFCDADCSSRGDCCQAFFYNDCCAEGDCKNTYSTQVYAGVFPLVCDAIDCITDAPKTQGAYSCDCTESCVASGTCCGGADARNQVCGDL